MALLQWWGINDSALQGQGVEMTLSEENGAEVPEQPEHADPPALPHRIDVSPYRVEQGAPVHLDKIDARTTGDFDGGKGAGKQLLKSLTKQLAELQEIFYAQNKHRLLIVLQALDTGGKDGTISHVFAKANPQGVRIASFKRPTEVELAHDYLWRVHPHTPARGEIVIFNRSHYEDVLVVRVRELAPKEVWKRRYEHINAFEKLLADEGTTILKFFLHISKEEQRERLQARIDDPEKHWKFDVGDLDERKRWDDYMRAFEEAVKRTSSEVAPWYVVPADRKWYRNLVVAQAVVDTLTALNPTYPESKEKLDGMVVE
jgi:PPK2 family polyphosphate:nucleotide phosphotransferase